MHLTQQIENQFRLRRSYLQKQSYQAYLIERRIDMEMKKVVKNLQPPFQKSKRPSKLPRYYLKKAIKPIVVEEKKITERAKFFFRAFHEDVGILQETDDIKDSIIDIEDGVQEQIVPFYFDHFLKLNGYTPNYNFKTQIELRDGAEVERLQVKSVIPEVLERMEQWQELKRKVMEDNIAKNPKMYVDVMS